MIRKRISAADSEHAKRPAAVSCRRRAGDGLALDHCGLGPRQRRNELPPSERITIAMFGVGNRGSSSLRAMKPSARPSGGGDCRLP